jgi:hypothetical protein
MKPQCRALAAPDPLTDRRSPMYVSIAVIFVAIILLLVIT